MADYAVNIDLPDHKLGDAWIGIATIGPVVVNGISQGNLTRIRMNFVKGSLVFKLDTEAGADALIVIDTPATWAAHIDPVEKFLPQAGEWNWDMQFTHDEDVSPITCYKGVLVVHPDVTK